MAKRDTGGVPRSFGVPGFSLESILEECRDKAPEETAAPETAETEYRPETEECRDKAPGLFLRAGGLPGRDGVRGRISGRRSGIPRIRRI